MTNENVPTLSYRLYTYTVLWNANVTINWKGRSPVRNYVPRETSAGGG
jgi:hypothetical protein